MDQIELVRGRGHCCPGSATGILFTTQTGTTSRAVRQTARTWIASLANATSLPTSCIDQGAPFDDSCFYNLYIKLCRGFPSVQTTSNLEKKRKEMEKTIDPECPGQEFGINTRKPFPRNWPPMALRSYDDLTTTVGQRKGKELDRTYVDAHFEELKEFAPRTSSADRIPDQGSRFQTPRSLTETSRRKSTALTRHWNPAPSQMRPLPSRMIQPQHYQGKARGYIECG